jgi:hypothetical protein
MPIAPRVIRALIALYLVGVAEFKQPRGESSDIAIPLSFIRCC